MSIHRGIQKKVPILRLKKKLIAHDDDDVSFERQVLIVVYWSTNCLSNLLSVHSYSQSDVVEFTCTSTSSLVSFLM